MWHNSVGVAVSWKFAHDNYNLWFEPLRAAANTRGNPQLQSNCKAAGNGNRERKTCSYNAKIERAVIIHYPWRNDLVQRGHMTASIVCSVPCVKYKDVP